MFNPANSTQLNLTEAPARSGESIAVPEESIAVLEKSIAVVTAYYQAFNQEDLEGFLALLTDDVIHDLNQGQREVGKAAFRDFMTEMFLHYSEQISQMNLMVSADGQRVAVESVVIGQYLKTQKGLPEANGQKYQLAVGAFFELRAGKIARVTSYYNLNEWLQQVRSQS